MGGGDVTILPTAHAARGARAGASGHRTSEPHLYTVPSAFEPCVSRPSSGRTGVPGSRPTAQPHTHTRATARGRGTPTTVEPGPRRPSGPALASRHSHCAPCPAGPEAAGAAARERSRCRGVSKLSLSERLGFRSSLQNGRFEITRVDCHFPPLHTIIYRMVVPPRIFVPRL